MKEEKIYVNHRGCQRACLPPTRYFGEKGHPLKPLPATIICYNAGVKLTAKDSTARDDLQHLEKAGAEILVCGTCVNYFGLGDQVAVGRISNMYEIAETMAGAARLVRP